MAIGTGNIFRQEGLENFVGETFGIGPGSAEEKASSAGKIAADNSATISGQRFTDAQNAYDRTLDDVQTRQRSSNQNVLNLVEEENQAKRGEFQSMLSNILSQGRRTAAASGLIGGTQESLGTQDLITSAGSATGESSISSRLAANQQNIDAVSSTASQNIDNTFSNVSNAISARNDAETADAESQFLAPRSSLDKIVGVWAAILGSRGE